MNYRKIISNNLKTLIKTNHTSRKELSIAIDVKYSTLCEWIKGTFYPNLDKLELIANYFNITIIDLITDKELIVIERKKIEWIIEKLQDLLLVKI